MNDKLGECDRCHEQAIGFNDYGEALCEDCMFEDCMFEDCVFEDGMFEDCMFEDFMEDSTLIDE